MLHLLITFIYNCITISALCVTLSPNYIHSCNNKLGSDYYCCYFLVIGLIVSLEEFLLKKLFVISKKWILFYYRAIIFLCILFIVATLIISNSIKSGILPYIMFVYILIFFLTSKVNIFLSTPQCKLLTSHNSISITYKKMSMLLKIFKSIINFSIFLLPTVILSKLQGTYFNFDITALVITSAILMSNSKCISQTLTSATLTSAIVIAIMFIIKERVYKNYLLLILLVYYCIILFDLFYRKELIINNMKQRLKIY